MYFDLDGEQISLSRGQYGVKRVDGKKLYLDIEGNSTFELSNYLNNHPISVLLLAMFIMCVATICGKRINILLLLSYIIFIIYMTLLYRTQADGGLELGLFWSYSQFFSSPQLRLEILNNIWLFLPLGTILYKLKPQWQVLLFAGLLSAGIEITQYLTGVGVCEFDDVFSNVLGSLIGFEIGVVIQQIR